MTTPFFNAEDFGGNSEYDGHGQALADIANAKRDAEMARLQEQLVSACDALRTASALLNIPECKQYSDWHERRREVQATFTKLMSL